MDSITTVSCHPPTLERMHEYRDENGHANLDEALKSLLEEVDFNDN